MLVPDWAPHRMRPERRFCRDRRAALKAQSQRRINSCANASIASRKLLLPGTSSTLRSSRVLPHRHGAGVVS